MGVWRELTAWKGCDKAWKRWAAETRAQWDAREKEHGAYVLAREKVWKARVQELKEESSTFLQAGLYIAMALGYVQGALEMIHAFCKYGAGRNRNSA